MQYGIAFTPLVPSLVLWIALAAIVVIAAVLLLARARGAFVPPLLLLGFMRRHARPAPAE